MAHGHPESPIPEPEGAAHYGAAYNPPPVGGLDRFIRHFGAFSYLTAVLVMYTLVALAFGLAAAPALAFYDAWWSWCAGFAAWQRWPLAGFGVGLAFFIAGFSLLVVVPLLNFLLPTRVKPFEGGYFSIASVPWFLHNGLFYIARYTFLPYVTLTPFGRWFLRAMGMRLGERVFINTEFISDPRLITLGDDVVIGGSVHLFAHFGGGGHLILAPTVIGARATIGQEATIMGDVQVGEDATVLPHSVLLPGSRVGAGETWGGVPARRIGEEEFEHFKQGIRGVAGRRARRGGTEADPPGR